MKKKLFIVLSLVFFISSCSENEDDFFPQPEDEEAIACKLLAYGAQFNLDGTYELLNRVEYENDRIVKRIIGTQYLRDSVVYDDLGRLWKLYKTPISDQYSYSVFEYDNPSATLPVKRWETNINPNSYNPTTTYEEFITYNESNQIAKTVIDHSVTFYNTGETLTENRTTNYIYNSEGNLIKKHFIKTNFDGDTEELIEVYGDYDTYKNPFKNFPFIDMRGIADSPNNWRHYEYTNYYNGEPGANSGHRTIESYSYNEYDYPEPAIYDCE